MISEGIVRSRWNLRHVLLWCAMERNILDDEGGADAEVLELVVADDDDALVATPPPFVGAFVVVVVVVLVVNNWNVRLMVRPMLRLYNNMLLLWRNVWLVNKFDSSR